MGPKGHVQVRRSLVNVPLLGFAVLSVFIIVTEIKIVAVVYNLYFYCSNLFFFTCRESYYYFLLTVKKKEKKYDLLIFCEVIRLLCLVQVHRTGT